MTARIRCTRPTRTDAMTPIQAHDLREYRSQADLIELAAVLDRHSDSETEELRELVDWTATA